MTLPVLSRDTPLRGADAGEWAVAILDQLGAPRPNVNCYALAGWFAREGGGGQNNPMNTTLETPGATGSINSAGVKDYATPADGVSATCTTLHSYPSIVVSLRDGHGLTGAGVPAELARWSGGGYDYVSPVVVPLPPEPAKGTFRAALAVNQAGRWYVHGAPSKGVQFGGDPETWWKVTVEVNRSSGEWRVAP